jgi:ubiquinone/menaquinone biosynthesis C-methylase UbiE
LPNATHYDSLYARRRSRAALLRIDSGVTGGAEIEKFHCAGFLGRGERSLFLQLLAKPPRNASARSALLDLGCGVGLVGCWMARRLKINLVGVDFSPIAVSLARDSARSTKTIGAEFVVAPFESTKLATGSISAVFSLDALYLASDPCAALDEVRRVSSQGSPFVFSYYVNAFSGQDWPKLVRLAGFKRVSVIDTTTAWRRYMQRKHQRRWFYRRAIQSHLGKWAEPELAVTRAMLGFDGRPAFIQSTSRYILHTINV